MLSILVIWYLGSHGWLRPDPMLWYVMMMVPAGPTALILSSVASMAHEDEGPVAGYLAIAYTASPLIAVASAIALKVIDSMIEHEN